VSSIQESFGEQKRSFGVPNKFVTICDIGFQLFIAFDRALILFQRMNKFLHVSAISHIMKVYYIRNSFKNELSFEPLVPSDFLLPQKMLILCIGVALKLSTVLVNGRTFAKASS
jgi:hypothetical protein